MRVSIVTVKGEEFWCVINEYGTIVHVSEDKQICEDWLDEHDRLNEKEKGRE